MKEHLLGAFTIWSKRLTLTVKIQKYKNTIANKIKNKHYTIRLKYTLISKNYWKRGTDALARK